MNKPRIVYAGTPDFAVPALAALMNANFNVVAVYTQPDRPAGRGRKLVASPVKQFALEHNLPIEQPGSLKTPEAIEKLTSYEPDLMVVAAYGLILPTTVLSVPIHGCLNIHASLLPRWRGAAPIQRAILAGDTETGITLMQMDAGLDTGAMLVQQSCSIESDATAMHLHDKLAELGASMLVQHLPNILTNKIVPQVQDAALATYAEKLTKQEAWINWCLPAEQIVNQVRAFNSWPVAQTAFKDKTLRIWQAAVVEHNSDAEPGTICKVSQEGVLVAAGSESVRLLQVQMPGAKAISARDFINTHDLLNVVLGLKA